MKMNSGWETYKNLSRWVHRKWSSQDTLIGMVETLLGKHIAFTMGIVWKVKVKMIGIIDGIYGLIALF
jgi:hypothetical protein